MVRAWVLELAVPALVLELAVPAREEVRVWARVLAEARVP